MSKKAIIAGASGLIGSQLLELLLAQPVYNEVLALVRKEIPLTHPRLKQLVIDFDDLASYTGQLKGDVVFCCLGSTKKKTPDLSQYRKVDHDYPLALTRIALKNNIKQYHLVSSIGANANASNFYAKMKGETENEIIKCGLNSLYIYRPSALEGERKENRPLERFSLAVMKLINPLLFGGLKKYRSIPAAAVASAIYKQSLNNTPGLFIYESDKIKELS